MLQRTPGRTRPRGFLDGSFIRQFKAAKVVAKQTPVGTPPAPPWIGPGPMPGPPGPAGAIGDIDYSMLPPELQQLPISFPFSGKPQTYAIVNVPIAFPVLVPPGLVGSMTYCATRPTLNPTFTVNKISADVTTALGVVVITGASTTSCILMGPGGALAVGDVLQVLAPPQDATLADLGITILTMRV